MKNRETGERRRHMRALLRWCVLAVSLGVPPVFAAGGAATPYTFKPDTTNMASLQRGVRNYMNYCAGCHSLKYMRYNRIGKDLGIPEDLLKTHLMFTSDKPGDVIKTAMVPADGEKWFGRTPPDLTLTARERGASWVYSYLLSFYLDPTKPTGVNNLVLPGAAMPHVLGGLQGWQRKVEEKPGEGESHGHHGPELELVQPGSLSPDEYKQFVGDLTNFMVYAAEPGRNARMAMGGWVLLYIVLFGALAWLLKKEYWKDVH